VALTIDSTLGELLADEKATAILEKHVPGILSHPQLAMGKGFSLKAIAPMSGGMLTQETLDAIAKDLANT
jgi:hypothetical protein